MSDQPPPVPVTAAPERVAMAASAFQRFRAQCFWSADPQLQVTEREVAWIISQLRLNGGHAGYRAAAELEQCR